MVSAETSVILAKACELFIIELACKSYVNSILFKRKTLQVEKIFNFSILLKIIIKLNSRNVISKNLS